MTRFAIALFLLVSTLLPSAALAQAEAVSARRAELVAASQKGPEFKNDKQVYRVVLGMQAVPRGDSTGTGRATALGIATADVVEQKGPYTIVTRTPTGAAGAPRLAAASAVSERAGAPAYPVVVNRSTGQLGVVSGTLVVKMANVDEAAALAKAHGLTVDYVAGSIGYAFLQVPAGGDIISTAAALRRDARVRSAYAEIRENFPVAR
jgi:hypothetical protein